MRILFVCLGNICRSPTAEAVLKAKLRDVGLEDEVKVDSAGTSGWHIGSKPDPRAIEAAAKRGYEVTGVARQADAADFVDFDVILGMDRWNVEDLHDIAFDEEAAERIGLFRDYDPVTVASKNADDLDVPDPYEGGADGFERVLDIVERTCDGLIEEILNAFGGGRRAKGLDSVELRKRAVSGFATELELIGTSSPSGGCLGLGGAWALITPTERDEPTFNIAFAESGDALAERIDEIAEAYSDGGVRSWQIWADVEDDAGAAMLMKRGLGEGTVRRAMAMALVDLRRPQIEIPSDVQIVAGRMTEIARVADQQAGLEEGWTKALSALPELPVRIIVARRDGYPIAGALTVDFEDDLVVCFRVAHPDVAGQGLIEACLVHLIEDAEQRGRTSISVRVDQAEADAYRELGFQDLGGFRSWRFTASD